MLEIKITIEAPELANAINNVASAMAGAKVQPAVAPTTVQAQAPTQPVAPAPVAAPAQTTAQAVAPTPAAPASAPVAAVPVASAPQYTVEQIMAAGATLMDAGKANELINLLHTFGVQAVMDLKPDQLGAFATEMRKLGAKI